MKNFVRLDFETRLAYIQCKDLETGENVLAKIDLDDLKLVDASTNGSWYVQRTDKGNNCACGYVMANSQNGSTVYLHRMVCRTPRGMETHHKDDDTLNNTRGNLKALTPKEHRLIAKQSDKPRPNNKSGYRGVVSKNGRYMAVYSSKSIGYFDDVKAAAECAKQYREWIIALRRADAVA